MEATDTEAILQEANLSRIRNLVNLNKIKWEFNAWFKSLDFEIITSIFVTFRLWLEPYFDKDNGPNESKLLQSANTLATTLEMDDLVVYQGLKYDYQIW